MSQEADWDDDADTVWVQVRERWEKPDGTVVLFADDEYANFERQDWGPGEHVALRPDNWTAPTPEGRNR